MVDEAAVAAEQTSAVAEQQPAPAAADPLTPAGGRYVIGFDGSNASRRALTWTAARAQEVRRPLVLAGVVEGPEEDGAADRARALPDLLAQRAAQLADSSDAPSVSTLVAHGDVATALVRAVRDGDALVVGTDKTGYATGRILGIRSIQLAAIAPGVLIVVPVADLRLRHGVVVAVADVPGMEEAVRTGAREALRRSTELHLVHAVPSPVAHGREERGERLLARAREAAAGEPGPLRMESHLVHRSPGDAILNFTRERALLVVRRTRHPVLGVGRTVHDLLVNANVPIAFLPPV